MLALDFSPGVHQLIAFNNSQKLFPEKKLLKVNSKQKTHAVSPKCLPQLAELHTVVLIYNKASSTHPSILVAAG